MACSYPITIERNGKHELVPCSKCINCIQRKRGEWSFRLLQEQKSSDNSTFLTLTYNEKNLPDDNQLSKKELQRYFKRVRTENAKLKYYAVGEYGSKNGRAHYHAIVFNCDTDSLVNKWSKRTETVNYNTGEITPGDNEPLGIVSCDEVNEASIHYVTGYITSKYGTIDEKTGKSIDTWDAETIRPFSLMSKGLGKSYLKHNTKLHKRNFSTETRREGGIKQNLPRYYRDKIFSSDKDEVLAKMGFVQFSEKEILAWRNQVQQTFNMLKFSKDDITAEFKKRQYRKNLVKSQIKKKTL